jgi:hypothetical protein
MLVLEQILFLQLIFNPGKLNGDLHSNVHIDKYTVDPTRDEKRDRQLK